MGYILHPAGHRSKRRGSAAGIGRLLTLLLALLATAQISFGADRGDDIVMQEAWIPMRDGVRLAADVYFPRGREPGAEHSGEALPVLLEYLPYRKTEGRASRLALYSYFIRRGYVVARVDIRGTGNSEGHLVEYEYSEQEQQDGEDAIAWLAGQPYASGRWFQFHSHGDAQPACAQGDPGDHGGRRLVRGRCALHRRMHAR
jgi:predicted acyl esterase